MSFFKKGSKTGFTSFTDTQLTEYQHPRVKLHAFTRVHQVSPKEFSVKLVKAGETYHNSHGGTMSQIVTHR